MKNIYKRKCIIIKNAVVELFQNALEKRKDETVDDVQNTFIGSPFCRSSAYEVVKPLLTNTPSGPIIEHLLHFWWVNL